MEDTRASEKPLLWGDVGKSEDGVRHCSFTSMEGKAPVEGERYAGKRSAALQ